MTSRRFLVAAITDHHRVGGGPDPLELCHTELDVVVGPEEILGVDHGGLSAGQHRFVALPTFRVAPQLPNTCRNKRG